MRERSKRHARLIIIGASGHGKVIAEIAESSGFEEIVFLDDDDTLTTCGAYPVLGRSSAAADMAGALFVAIGNAAIRKRLMERYADRSFPVLIHPKAVVSTSAVFGRGSVVMAGAVVNPDARLGEGVIVNTAATVDHDCTVGDFAHIAVGAHLCGTVKVGAGTWIGAGAVVSNNITVCSGCMLGAGAVVVRDISEPGIYIGVPAKKSSE